MNKRTPIIAVLNDWGTVMDIFGDLGAECLDIDAMSEVPRALKNADAVVFCGGGDIDPSRYGYDERHKRVYGVSTQRDDEEFLAIRMARKLRIPVLGICRGMQLINVAWGGTLHQHIHDGADDLLPHGGTDHAVKLRRSSRIARVLNTGILNEVTSLHHQAVDRLGDGLVPVGWATDGTVEMIETAPGVKPYMLGTQFHPEMDYRYIHYPAEEIFRHIMELATQHSISVGRLGERLAEVDDLTSWNKMQGRWKYRGGTSSSTTSTSTLSTGSPGQRSVATYLDNISGVEDTMDVAYFRSDDDEEDYDLWLERHSAYNAARTTLGLQPQTDIERADAMCIMSDGCKCPLDCLEYDDCAARAAWTQQEAKDLARTTAIEVLRKAVDDDEWSEM